MPIRRTAKRVSAMGLTALWLWLGSRPALAQCVMCYMNATGAGAKAAHTLRIGILILAIPTMTILAGLVVVAIRRRNSGPSWDAPPATERIREEPLLPQPTRDGKTHI
jgi:hypothetical protein